MSQALLHITHEPEAPAEQAFIERRRSPRHAVTTHVTAVNTCDGPEGRRRICRLELTNLSQHGIGAISAEPISVGSHMAVLLPPHGPEHGFDLHGTVVRCTARKWGHEIGIELDLEPRRAA